VVAAIAADPVWRLVLAGIAATTVAERLWFQATTFLRAQAELRTFALLELAHAALQLAGPLLLALAWGLQGAVAGLALAYGGGLALLSCLQSSTWSRQYGPAFRWTECLLDVQGGRQGWRRRLNKLSCAGWLPHDRGCVSGLPRSKCRASAYAGS